MRIIPLEEGKAKYFLRYGFVPEHPRIMMDALIEHAKSSARTDLCTFVAKPDRGLLMVIDAMMETPDGVTERPIRSVWQLTMDESVTEVFVTAYAVRQPAP